MINSVSSVSFKANPQVSAQDRLSQPGAYTIQSSAPKQAKPKKKGGFWKGLAAVVVTAAAAGALLVAGFRTGKLAVLENDALKEATLFKKARHYMAKLGECLDTNVWQRILGIFGKSGKGAEGAEKAVA